MFTTQIVPLGYSIQSTDGVVIPATNITVIPTVNSNAMSMNQIITSNSNITSIVTPTNNGLILPINQSTISSNISNINSPIGYVMVPANQSTIISINNVGSTNTVSPINNTIPEPTDQTSTNSIKSNINSNVTSTSNGIILNVNKNITSSNNSNINNKSDYKLKPTGTKLKKERLIAPRPNNSTPQFATMVPSSAPSVTYSSETRGLKRPRKYYWEFKKEASSFYDRDNISLTEKAEKLEVPIKIFHHGIEGSKTKPIPLIKLETKKYTSDEKNKAIELYNQGNTTLTEVSQKLGMSLSPVQRWVQKPKHKNQESDSVENKEQSNDSHDQYIISQSEIPQKFLPSTIDEKSKVEKTEPKIKPVPASIPIRDLVANLHSRISNVTSDIGGQVSCEMQDNNSKVTNAHSLKDTVDYLHKMFFSRKPAESS